MRIEALEVTLVEVPLAHTFGGSSYAADRRCTVIVEVRTDDGVTGRIHCGDERDGLANLGRLLAEHVAPQVLGRDAGAIEARAADLWRASPSAASGIDQGLYVHAISAVDLALWDALGKRAGMPVHRLWGGAPDALPAFVIGGYYETGKSLDDLAEEVAGYAASGFGGLKLKVGGLSPLEDLRRLERVRAVLGGDVAIACDANQGWSLAEATSFARGAEDFAVSWFEEPISWHTQYRDLRALRERTTIPVCAGQSEHTPEGAVRLIDAGCVDILNYDASWGGGPSVWRRVAHYAQVRGVALAHHEEPHVSSHLLTAVDRGMAVEFFHAERDPVWHEMLVDPPRITGGTVTPSQRPGFGLEYDADFVARYTVAGGAQLS